MKANLLKNIVVLCLTFIQLLGFSTVYAKSTGGAIAGGGGDSYEKRVDDIRSDILNWIKSGGSQGLNLNLSLSNEEYVSKMNSILISQYVVVNFVEEDHESDEELQVSVNGLPKTCRGFLAKKDNRPHILCDLNRFKKTTESDQYRLIHHEFAGLAGLERNDGAASDYFISSQLTSYLQRQTVLKLSIKKAQIIENRVTPFIELKKSKYLKNGTYEVTFIARNMQDTSELKVTPYNEKNWDSCNLPLEPLVFSEEVLEHKVLIGGKTCPVAYRPAKFEEGIVEFKDGVIKTLGFQRINYVAGFDLNNNPKIKINSEIIKEVIGQKISEYGHKLKTIRRTVKFTFKTTAEQIKNTRVVSFGTAEEMVTDDPQQMADYLNTKEIFYDFVYVQNTDVTSAFCLEKCHFTREKVFNSYSLEKNFSQYGNQQAEFLNFLSNDFMPVPRFILMRDVNPERIE